HSAPERARRRRVCSLNRRRRPSGSDVWTFRSSLTCQGYRVFSFPCSAVNRALTTTCYMESKSAGIRRADSLLPACDLIVNPNQLVFRCEFDLDAAARPMADDPHSCAQDDAEALFGGACVNVNWRRRG